MVVRDISNEIKLLMNSTQLPVLRQEAEKLEFFQKRSATKPSKATKTLVTCGNSTSFNSRFKAEFDIQLSSQKCHAHTGHAHMSCTCTPVMVDC
jgi:hypothetical protein